MNETDSHALARWTESRDAEAFRTIVLRHGGMVYATCHRILGDAIEAEDVAQECFEDLARKGKKAPADHLGPWLHRVATNRALQHVRTLTRRREREKRYMTGIKEHQELDLDDTYRFVDKAIAGLPEKLRIPVVGYFLEGRSQNDIAREMGVSRQTVTDRVRLGVEHIRKSLERKGITVAAAALTGLLKSQTAQAAPAALIETMGKLALSGGVAKTSSIALSWATMAKIGAVVLVVVVAGVVVIRPWNETPTEFDQNESTSLSPEPAEVQRPVTSQAVAPDDIEAADEAAADDVLAIIEITPDRGVTISGTVLLPSGRSAADAAVTAFTKEDPESWRFGVTDEDGRFAITGFVGNEEINVFAELEDLKSRTEGPIPLTNEGMADLELALVKTGGFRGIVVDSSGTPLPDVGFQLYQGNEVQRESQITTSEDGGFEYLRLVPGKYSLGISTPGPRGPLATEGGVVQVYSGHVREDVRIVLDMGGDAFLAGRVADPDGVPIESAYVRIERGSGWYARTDADGRYRIDGVSRAHTYCLMVSSADHVDGKICDVSPDTEDADFVLASDAATLRGRVVRALDGAPVPEFGIRTAAGGIILSPRQLDGLPFDTFKDDEGRFTIDDFHHYGGGWATIIVRAQGYATRFEQARINPVGPTSEILIRLEAEAFVDGVVVDRFGGPVPGARIVVGRINNTANIMDNTAALAHADGTFELGGLSSETDTLSAYHPDFAIGVAQVAPTPGSRQPVRIVLSRGGAIEGLVTAAGKPLAEVIIRVHRTGESSRMLHDAKSDMDGRYRIAGIVSNDDLEISAFYPKGFPGSRDGNRLIRPVAVRDDAVSRVDFDFGRHTGVLEGRIEYDGELAPDSFVSLHVDGDGGLDVRSEKVENGLYRFENVPPGNARLRAKAFFSGMRHIVRRKSVDLVLAPNGHTEVVVDFARGGMVAGRVDGLALDESAYVDAFEGAYTTDELNAGVDRYRGIVWQGPADEDGRFRAEGFSPGVYTVMVTVSVNNTSTASERMATLRTASQIVSISEEDIVEIQFSAR